MSDMAAMGMLAFMAFAVVYVFYSIGCARKADAMMQAYTGFFTKMEAYLYVNAITVAVVCMVMLVAVIGGLFTFVSMAVDILLYIALAVACLCYVANKRKKLSAKYGEVAAKEILKAMRIVGNGRAFRSAARIFGFITFESLNPKYMETESGEWVRVVQTGRNTFIDAEGNTYSAKDIA